MFVRRYDVYLCMSCMCMFVRDVYFQNMYRRYSILSIHLCILDPCPICAPHIIARPMRWNGSVTTRNNRNEIINESMDNDMKFVSTVTVWK